MQTRTETNVCTEPVADFMKWYLLRISSGTKQRNAAIKPLANAVNGSPPGADAKPIKDATAVLIMILTIIVASFIGII